MSKSIHLVGRLPSTGAPRRGTRTTLLLFLCALCLASPVGAAIYYVDYLSGADSNSGTSTGAAWQHQPFMPNFTGSYTHAAGDQFIFRGGETWPSNCFGMAITAGGVAGSPDIYTVNSNWFVGASFTRPVFDGQYQVYYLVYPEQPYVGFFGLEMRNVNCQQNYGQGIFSLPNNHDVGLTNCWLHGWTLTNTLSSDDAHGGFIANFSGIGITNIILDHCKIDNAGHSNNGVCVRMAGQMNYCEVCSNSSGILFCGDFNHGLLHDINGAPFDGVYHSNGDYMDWATGIPNGPLYCRNSVIWNCAGGANSILSTVHVADCYVYNNLVYGTISSQCAVEVDPYDNVLTGVMHSAYVYNNTLVPSVAGQTAVNVVTRSSQTVSNLWATNNLVISPDNTGTVSDVNTSVALNIGTNRNILLTLAAATADGYTVNNLYQPTSAGNPTVAAGANLSALGLFTADLLGTPYPATSAWDVGCYEFAGNSTSSGITIVPPTNGTYLQIVPGNQLILQP